MANIKDRIRKELEIQKKIDSTCDIGILLTFLDCIKTSNQWNSFVNVKWYKTENDYIRFYYPTEELKKLYTML